MLQPYWTSRCGRHVLYNADCLEVLPGLRGVDAVVTDIPYNCSQKHGGLRELDYGEWDKGFDWTQVVPLFLRKARTIAVWCHEKQLSGILSEIENAGWIDRPLAWVKPNPTVINGQHIWLPGIESCAFGKTRGSVFNAHCHPGYWFVPPEKDRHHPCQKPLKIIAEQVEAMTNKNELVCDPFTGSGTTGVACIRTGRKFIGIEISREYCDIAVRRMERELSQPRLPGIEPERLSQLSFAEAS